MISVEEALARLLAPLEILPPELVQVLEIKPGYRLHVTRKRK